MVITRLEATCRRALQGNHINYRIIKNILDRNLDKIPLIAHLDFFITDHEKTGVQKITIINN